MINGEKAVYCTPTFAVKRERTLGQLLEGVEKTYSQEVSRVDCGTLGLQCNRDPQTPSTSSGGRIREYKAFKRSDAYGKTSFPFCNLLRCLSMYL